ncbi:GNAT family N-acetyltransferase [Paenibacillus sp. JCM 10914]|uniref:GNAT family N-acetyltransferase n=1 Tax=Paenibacillus sp. JCM 10914 TaxID=1236974 RepID=UPI0003CC88BB|nr:GNAT family N-acetyltransferase [Paenibacillus sp. JCM 10914]GAE05074.1 acetyltransferase, GNAT family [Paenibacillus sp. JCM 10914]
MQIYQQDIVSLIEPLSLFIARLNRKDRHHVGYCGEDPEEIHSTLREDFADAGEMDRWFTLLMDDKGDIRAALGFNVDPDSRTAEIWGPFIEAEDEWSAIAEQLWATGMTKLEGQVDRMFGFYNEANQFAKRFILKKGGRRTGEHIVLRAEPSSSPSETSPHVVEFTPNYTEDFQELHDNAFPDTYYDAERILKMLDQDRRLFVIVDQGQLAGYVYVEGDSDIQDGSIEYIAVSERYRRLGYGQSLLEKALQFLFREVKATEISLCVEYSNHAAIGLYNATGFRTVHKLSSYVL